MLLRYPTFAEQAPRNGNDECLEKANTQLEVQLTSKRTIVMKVETVNLEKTLGGGDALLKSVPHCRVLDASE